MKVLLSGPEIALTAADADAAAAKDDGLSSSIDTSVNLEVDRRPVLAVLDPELELEGSKGAGDADAGLRYGETPEPNLTENSGRFPVFARSSRLGFFGVFFSFDFSKRPACNRSDRVLGGTATEALECDMQSSDSQSID
jgi:hypothetical protein